MEKDILVILMMAFGLFAILMFILFYIYAKKYYNTKHLTDNYLDDNEECDLIDIMINGKIITFDANNYILSNDENVKVMMDNNTYDGVVKKGNYNENINNIIETPRLLVLDTSKENNVENSKPKEEIKLYDSINEPIIVEEESVNFENDAYDEMDFVPKKKKINN